MDKTIVVALIAGTPSLVAAYLVYRSSRRATEEQANLAWAKELRQDAADARREVQQLREEVRDLRRQLTFAQGEADHWITEHRALRQQAWRPGMTLDRFRDLIGPIDPPAATANGR